MRLHSVYLILLSNGYHNQLGKQYKKFVNNGTFLTQLALKRYILGTIVTLLSNWEVCNNFVLTWDRMLQDLRVNIPPSPPGK
jgi:hypothetical protein